MKNRRHELSDAQWNMIKTLFPQYRTGRPAQHSNHKMFNAMLWISKTGAPWRDLPEYYGPWKSVYTRMSRWTDSGLLERIFQTLNDTPDLENLHMDATIVSAHQHSAGAKKGGPITKKTKLASVAVVRPPKFIP